MRTAELCRGRERVTETAAGYIGVDIGGTNMRGALVLHDGTIMERFRIKSSIAEGAEAFLSRLIDEVLLLLHWAADRGVQVRGVGLGIPGLIGADGIIHSSVNLRPLEGLNLADLLMPQVAVPVVSANDANLIALGEAQAGAGHGMRSLMVVTIGTGLGSGLILDGRLWSGADGFAAEFGHITVVPEGVLCPCGNRGCLEQYVSAAALSRYGGGRAPEELAAAARAGEAAAIEAFNTLGYWLGTALAGLMNTLNLECILIGGGVAAGYDLFAPSVKKQLLRRAFPQMVERVVVCQTALGDDAGLVGAALLAATAGVGPGHLY